MLTDSGGIEERAVNLTESCLAWEYLLARVEHARKPCISEQGEDKNVKIVDRFD